MAITEQDFEDIVEDVCDYLIVNNPYLKDYYTSGFTVTLKYDSRSHKTRYTCDMTFDPETGAVDYYNAYGDTLLIGIASDITNGIKNYL